MKFSIATTVIIFSVLASSDCCAMQNGKIIYCFRNLTQEDVKNPSPTESIFSELKVGDDTVAVQTSGFDQPRLYQISNQTAHYITGNNQELSDYGILQYQKSEYGLCTDGNAMIMPPARATLINNWTKVRDIVTRPLAQHVLLACSYFACSCLVEWKCPLLSLPQRWNSSPMGCITGEALRGLSIYCLYDSVKKGAPEALIKTDADLVISLLNGEK